MTMYSADDVRAEYEKHPNTFSADLTDEQATTIASLWNTIKASVLKRYDEDRPQAREPRFRHHRNRYQ